MTISQYDLMRFDVLGDFDGVDDVTAVYQAKYMSAASRSDAQVLADWKTIFADLWDIVKGIHNVLTVIRRVRGYNITTSQLMGESDYGTPLVGTATGQSTASQVTLPLTFKTLYPKIMLRKMFGPTSDDIIDVDGRVGSAGLTVLGNAAAFLMAPLATAGVVYEYGYNSPIALTWVVPTVGVFSAAPGTLRRRRLGQGS